MSNFEMVIVGDMVEEEEGSDFMSERGSLLPPELYPEDGGELIMLGEEQLMEIKDEELKDVDDTEDSASERWSMSPCLSEREQVVGEETWSDPEVPFEPAARMTMTSKNKSVFYSGSHHLQKPWENNNQLRIVRLQNLIQEETYRPLNLQGQEIMFSKVDQNSEPRAPVLDVDPIVSFDHRAPLIPCNNLPQNNLSRASQPSSRKVKSRVPILLKSRVPPSTKVPKSTVSGPSPKGTEVSTPVTPLVNINQLQNTQQVTVLRNAHENNVHKNMNLWTITGKIISKKETDVNPDPLAVDYHCINCNKNFDNPLLLMYHDCPDPNCKFHCKICPKKFISSKSLQNHIINKHLELNIVDDNLDVFPVIPLVRVEEWYTGKIYTPKPNLNCAVCKFVTESKKSLKRHIKSHFNVKYIKCQLCDARFVTKFKLKMHCKRIHGTTFSKHTIDQNETLEINKFSCKNCNTQFQTKLALYIHSKNHLTSCKTKPNLDHGKIVKKKYKCKICNKILTSRLKVNRHIFTAHDRQKIAQFCSRNANTESESESSFMCKECDFKCTTSFELQNHVNFHLIFKFKCKHCGIFLMNESELEKHLQISHKNEETTTLEVDLQIEEDTVRNNNSTSTLSKQDIISEYSCKYCDKVYAHLSTLEYHQKMQHEDEGDAENVQVQKLTKSNKKSTIEKEKSDKTTVKKSRKQNLSLKEDKNIEVITLETINSNTVPNSVILSDEVNEVANSSGSESDIQRFEETTEFMEENSDHCKTNEETNISDEEEPTIDTPSEQIPLPATNDSEQNYLIACGLCNIIYPTLHELYTHSEKHHEITKTKLNCQNSSGPFQCIVCQTRFVYRVSLKQHILRHRGILPYQCKYCGRMFGCQGNVRAHHKSCYKIKECNDASQNHSKKDDSNEKESLNTYTQISCNQLYACDICEIYCTSARTIYKHTQTVHSNNFVKTMARKGKKGKMKCDECSNSYCNLSQFRYHKMQHRGVKAFPCMFCTNIYSNCVSNTEHYNHAHCKLWKFYSENEEMKLKQSKYYMFEGFDYVSLTKIDSEEFLVFNCHKCDIVFKTKNEVYKHCKEKHADVRNTNKFFCKYCNKDFRLNKQLVSHRRVHLKQKNVVKIGPFYCENCSQEFTRFDMLEKHIKCFNCKNNTKSGDLRISELGIRTHQKRKISEPREVATKRLKTVSVGFNDKSGSSELSLSENSSKTPERVGNKRSNSGEGFANANQKKHKIDRYLVNRDSNVERVSKSENKDNNLEVEKNNSKSQPEILTVNHNACVKFYQCNLCKEKFSSLSQVHNHSEKSHEVVIPELPGMNINTGPFQCNICDNGYSSLLLLNNHKLAHRNIKPYPCKFCGKHCTSVTTVLYHYRKYHKKLYEADYINRDEKVVQKKQAKKVKKVNNHVNSMIKLNDGRLTDMFHYVNTYSQIYSCSICNIYYSDINYLEQHAKKLHSNISIKPPVNLFSKSGPYRCDECEHSNTKKFNMKVHKFKHRNIKPFPCLFCKSYFVDFNTVYVHYNTKHKQEWKYNRLKKAENNLLESLNKTYMFEGSKYITLTEFNGKKLSFECHKCKLVFDTRDETVNHCKDKHSQDQKDKKGGTSSRNVGEPVLSVGQSNVENVDDHCCKYCGKVFISQRTLNMHYWNKHKAQISKKVVKPNSVSNQTLQVENIILKYSCNICDQKFRSNLELQKHKQTLHGIYFDNIKKPKGAFKCKICDQKFANFEVLKSHLFKLNCKSETKSQLVEQTDGTYKNRKKIEPDETRKSNRLKPDGNKFDAALESSNLSAQECTNQLQQIVENEQINSAEKSTNESPSIHNVEQPDMDSENEEIDEQLNDREDENLSYDSESEKNHSTSRSSKNKSPSSSPILTVRLNAVVNFYQCNLCKEKFSSLPEVHAHSEECHGVTLQEIPGMKINVGPFQCNVCDNGYSSLLSLQNHNLAHRKIKPFPCKYCGKHCTSVATVLYHYKKCHKKLYIADCVKAKKVHEKIKCGGKRIKFPSNKSSNKKLNTSIFNNVNSYSQLYACNICKIYYSNVHYMYQHVKKFHSNNCVQPPLKTVRTGGYRCDECVQSFTKRFELRMHKFKHRNISAFPCSFCKLFFNGLSVYTYHRDKFHKLEWELYKQKNNESRIADLFENVTKRFMFEGSKYITLSEISSGRNLSFECHECQLIFETRDEALSHCEMKHSRVEENKNSDASQQRVGVPFLPAKQPRGEKVYKCCCMYCGKMFVTQREMKLHHLSVHEAERLKKGRKKSNTKEVKNVLEFCCHVCDLTFNSNLKLNKHKQVLHGLDTDNQSKHKRTFYCEDCKHEFVRFDTLKKHITSSACKNKNKERNVTEESTSESPSIHNVQQPDMDSENEEIDEQLNDREDENLNYDSESEKNHSTSQSSKNKSSSSSPILTVRLDAVVNFYQCNLCKEKFSSLPEVHAHSEECHEVTLQEVPAMKINVGPFQCNVCDNGYASLLSLQNHKLAHREIKPYPCKYCGKHCTSVATVLYHYKKCHKKLYIADCVKAKKLNGNNGNKTRKILIRNKNPNAKLNTSIFYNVNSYSQLHACNICKIYYPKVKFLYQHAQKCHSDNFIKLPTKKRNKICTFKCDECDHSFTHSQSVKVHKLKHRNILPYPCVFCSVFYRDTTNLNVHCKEYHQLDWDLHKQKNEEKRTSISLKNVKERFMFESSKYITLSKYDGKRFLSFECHKCKLVLNTRDEAINHCKTKHYQYNNGDTSQCDNISQLSFGQTSVDKVDKYCCKYCGKNFISLKTLNMHYCNKHEIQALEEGVIPLSNQTLEVENVVIEFCCNICDCTFDNHLELQKHQQNIHDLLCIDTMAKQEELFNCEGCGQEFTNFEVLKKHITSLTCKLEIKPLEFEKTEVGMVTCQKRKMFVAHETDYDISKIFKGGKETDNIPEGLKVQSDCSLSSMQDHLHSSEICEGEFLTINSTDSKSFTCSDCNTSFDAKSELYTHMKCHLKYYYYDMDKSNSKLTCKKCYKTFKTQSHLKSHICIDVKTYTCAVCKAVFVSKHLYVVHKITHEKSFICKICGDGFVSKGTLNVHTVRRHEEPKYLCDLCGTKYPFKANLAAHLIRHKNKEYACKGCDKKFVTLVQSQQHYNLTHSRVCLFCKFCSRSFNRRDHLNEHEQLHTKTRRTFKCEPCNRQFPSKGGLKNHVIHSHNIS